MVGAQFKPKASIEFLRSDGSSKLPLDASKLIERGLPLCNEDGIPFIALLKSCTKNKDLHAGVSVHHEIVKRGLLGECLNPLITMYAHCGAIDRAKILLDTRDIFSWTALICTYAQKGQGQNALNCFDEMYCKGISPDAVTLSCILKVCGSMKAAVRGEQIHDEIARKGLLVQDIVLGNALVDMYAKCGGLTKARKVLEELPVRDVVSWNALIAGYAQEGQLEQALKCVHLMQGEGLSPNAVTFSCILKTCSSIAMGEHIHDEVIRRGLFQDNVVLGNALLDMYAKCGALPRAQQLLEELPFRDVVSWNTIISAYVQQDQGHQALDCYDRMQHEGISPDTVTLSCILKACGSIGAADKGEQIHEASARSGLLKDNIVLGNALVDMYSKCGVLTRAQCVLEELGIRSVVSYSALVSGYTQQGQAEEAIECYEQMRREGLSPTKVTLSSILKACGSIRAADKGEQIHDEIVRKGLLSGDDVVLGNSVVDMYSKCGALAKARQVLVDLPVRNAASWNALIAGYVEDDQGEQALLCYEHMRHDGIVPCKLTFLSLLKACSIIGAADKGAEIHKVIVKQGLFGGDAPLQNALVDMYAKCGALGKAEDVLGEVPVRDGISWNALVAGYAQYGYCEKALRCLERMRCEGLSPDEVTFLGMLNACSHLSLIEDAQMYLSIMHSKYGIKPSLKHYTCILDLLGRAGRLDMAIGVTEKLLSCTFSCDYVRAVWSVLLGACQKWENVNVGRWVFERAIETNKNDGAAYVCMANMYTASDLPAVAKV